MESTPADSNPPKQIAAGSNKPEITFFFDEKKTVAGMFKHHYEKSLSEFFAVLTPDQRAGFHFDFLRYFDPWPDWVLRIAAEVFHIRLPTIPKETIEDTLRYFHRMFWVIKPESYSKEQMPKEPKLDSKVIGALMGHALANFERFRQRIEAMRGIIPADKLAEFENETSPDEFQKKIAPIVSDYFRQKPEGFIEFQKAFANAERATFDKNGKPKETPLSSIYTEILSDWTVVERLSGPKALTQYLSAKLGNQDFEDKHERVKKICQRMGITFKPFVKGH